MEFILRHLPDYRDPPDGGGRLDQLLSLSMVWANHLFLGCSYHKDLLDKVMEMADGIEVEDLPQFTTRSELMKKGVNEPRFYDCPKTTHPCTCQAVTERGGAGTDSSGVNAAEYQLQIVPTCNPTSQHTRHCQRFLQGWYRCDKKPGD
ncbi:CDKN2AIP N-terminal-like protein [Fukomys damarensis]|uniref:CDKN2AIP N-terminal-like protein n=1 Tax=Fukomys damarensis TaxID=885580 RepID=A0A091DUY1_FUKDA|nr:CDKN2AIP N-terminal-like protein [Fukomys damarensis]